MTSCHRQPPKELHVNSFLSISLPTARLQRSPLNDFSLKNSNELEYQNISNKLAKITEERI